MRQTLILLLAAAIIARPLFDECHARISTSAFSKTIAATCKIHGETLVLGYVGSK